MTNKDILFRFVGPKDADGNPTEYIPGVPARDLTAEDVVDAKRNGLFDDIKKVSIYKAVAKPEKADKPAKPDKADTAPESAPNAQAADAAKEG